MMAEYVLLSPKLFTFVLSEAWSASSSITKHLLPERSTSSRIFETLFITLGFLSTGMRITLSRPSQFAISLEVRF